MCTCVMARSARNVELMGTKTDLETVVLNECVRSMSRRGFLTLILSDIV